MNTTITTSAPRTGVIIHCEHYSLPAGIGIINYRHSRARFEIEFSNSNDKVVIDEVTDAMNALLRENDPVEVFLDSEADITVIPLNKWEQLADCDVDTIDGATITRSAQFYERDGTLRQVHLVNLPECSNPVLVADPIDRGYAEAMVKVRTILPENLDGKTGVIISKCEHLHHLRHGIDTPAIGQKMRMRGVYWVLLDGNTVPCTIFVSQLLNEKSPLLAKGDRVKVRLSSEPDAEPSIEPRADWLTPLRKWGGALIQAIKA